MRKRLALGYQYRSVPATMPHPVSSHAPPSNRHQQPPASSGTESAPHHCGNNYLCTAKKGYDTPPGLGTPDASAPSEPTTCHARAVASCPPAEPHHQTNGRNVTDLIHATSPPRVQCCGLAKLRSRQVNAESTEPLTGAGHTPVSRDRQWCVLSAECNHDLGGVERIWCGGWH